MAELQEEVLTEQTQETPAEPEQIPEQIPEQAPEAKPTEPEKPPKEKRRLLLPVLTALLILVGISEVIFWSLMGINSYRVSRARQQYEERLAAAEAEREAQGITGASAYGPGLKVENGTVTWRWEDEIPAPESGEAGPAQSTSGEKRLSQLYVPQIDYVLADQSGTTDTPEQSS